MTASVLKSLDAGRPTATGRRIVRRPIPDTLPELPADAPPLLARVYGTRAVASSAELDYSLQRLQPFGGLTDIGAAVDLLVSALDAGSRVLVVGDRYKWNIEDLATQAIVR